MKRTYTKYRKTCGLKFRLNNGKQIRYMVMVLFLN